MKKIFYKKNPDDSLKDNKNFKSNKLRRFVKRALSKYLERLKQEGLKNRISRAIPGGEIDIFILKQVRKYLSSKRTLVLGKGLGIIDVQYKKNGIHLDPAGFLRLAIKRITITDNQILYAVDSIIEQIQQKYVDDSSYITDKMNLILSHLSDTGIYKPKTSEEKTIYDLALIIVLNYYRGEEKPEWIESAINNLKRGEFVEDWIELILDHIYTVVTNISENLYFDFKITFDSIFIRTLFNKKTNNGQISKLLSLMGIDIKNIIHDIAYDYLSPSFIKGSGELLRDIAETFMCNFGGRKFIRNKRKKLLNNSEVSDEDSKKGDICLRQITMTFGENIDSERAFRWYSSRKLDLFLEISNSENFKDSIKFESKCTCVPCPRPVINLGIITSYSIKKSFMYSAEVKNLKNDIQYYYRICDKEGLALSDIFDFTVNDPHKDFEFVVLADSQGMVKYDYDLFLDVFNAMMKNSKSSDFVVHMGDFVDDGNNEVYWEWVLNSKLWTKNVIVPLSGNHEAKSSPISSRAGVENSIIRHFNLKGLPEQSLNLGTYYSYIYNNALFIVLNTNDMDEFSRLDQKQYCWAVDTAKNSNLKWKILLTHKSPYSNGPHHDERDVEEIGQQIINLVYEAEIDLVISGHDHVYIRTPSLSMGKCLGRANKKINYNGIFYDTFSNLFGTIFVTPGTSGVKNYKIDYGTTFPTEKILDLNAPVCSKVKVTDDIIYFTSYIYNTCNNNLEYLDSFAIEKTDRSYKYINSDITIKRIEQISDSPWVYSEDKIEDAFNLFKELDYSQRLEVSNYRKLNRISKLNKKYNSIISADIEIVRNKKEFMNALSNTKIKTIVVDCAEIKFENRLGCSNKIFIDRDLCIRGTARLLFVNFIIRNGAMLILGDSICIDNSRRITSIYRPINAVEVRDDSCFIMVDYSSIRCFGGLGIGKSHGIYLSSIGGSAFLNTKSQNCSSGEFVYAPNNDTYVFIGKGKYFSCKKSYAIHSSGRVKMLDGVVCGMKLTIGSKTSIYGGRITGGNKSQHLVPIKCMGKLKIYGAKIDSCKNKAINLNGSSAKLYIFPDHEGAIRINDTNIFIGEIKVIEDKIKVIIPRKSIKEGYSDISLYSFTDDIKNSLNFKLVRSKIKNGDILKTNYCPKKLVIMARTYKDILKGAILISGGAKCYIFSKFNNINDVESKK